MDAEVHQTVKYQLVLFFSLCLLLTHTLLMISTLLFDLKLQCLEKKTSWKNFFNTLKSFPKKCYFYLMQGAPKVLFFNNKSLFRDQDHWSVVKIYPVFEC